MEGDFKQFVFLQGEIILAFKLYSEMQGNSKSRVGHQAQGGGGISLALTHLQPGASHAHWHRRHELGLQSYCILPY